MVRVRRFSQEMARGMTRERRRSTRVKARLKALVTELDTGQVRRVVTRDLSSVGICFVDHALLAANARVAVEVTVPGRHAPLHMTCAVVWSKQVGAGNKRARPARVETGAEIITIQPDDQTFLIRYGMLHAAPPKRKTPG